nr:signal peptidase I [Flexivirga meconopsidis]
MLVSASIAVLVVLCVLALIALAFSTTVSGQSMQPTLRSGDRMVVNVLNHGSGASRFDLVELPLGPQRERAVKRLIGLPGDQVRMSTVAGKPLVEVKRPGQAWEAVDNPAWRPGGRPVTCCDKQGRMGVSRPTAATVPADAVWVLGDNLDASQDSRIFGFVRRDDIGATLNWRIFPLGDFGPVERNVRFAAE